MARHVISSYKAAWNYKDKEGVLVLFWKEASRPWGSNMTNPITVTDPMEFQMMVDLLRNESPVEYDPEQHKLVTGFEPAGEGEGM